MVLRTTHAKDSKEGDNLDERDKLIFLCALVEVYTYRSKITLSLLSFSVWVRKSHFLDSKIITVVRALIMLFGGRLNLVLKP